MGRFWICSTHLLSSYDLVDPGDQFHSDVTHCLMTEDSAFGHVSRVKSVVSESGSDLTFVRGVATSGGIAGEATMRMCLKECLPVHCQGHPRIASSSS